MADLRAEEDETAVQGVESSPSAAVVCACSGSVALMAAAGSVD